MRWSVFVGGLVSISLAVSGILMGSPLLGFVDPPTVCLVAFLPIAFLMQAHGVAGLRTAKRVVGCWLRSDILPPEQLMEARCVVETAAKATVKGALVCVLIGAIQILQHAPDDFGTMGPAMAVMMLSYFYAHCINFVLWGPLGRWLAQHAQTASIDAQT